MVVNKLQLGLHIVAVKTPHFQGTELLQDLACFTGAELVGDQFSEYQSLSTADPPYILGKIKSAKIDAKSCVFKGLDNSQKIQDRIDQLENEYNSESLLLGDFEKENLMERIGKLKGGLCIIRAGGLSEVEMQETRDRIEDSLFAVKAGIQDGYVLGGGFALIAASRDLILEHELSE